MADGSQVDDEISFEVNVAACTSLDRNWNETNVVMYELGSGPME